MNLHPDSASHPKEAVWIDLCAPSAQERLHVESQLGLRLPTQDAIAEIESSSRAYVDDGVFYFSAPVLQGGANVNAVTPVGFVLSAEHLVTLHFAPVSALTEFARASDKGVAREVFLAVLELIVANAADALEHASAELDRVSKAAFGTDSPQGLRLPRASAALHAGLRNLGRIGESISHIRDSLMGIGRIVSFVLEHKGSGLEREKSRLNALHSDIQSLNDYQSHLSSKVQFVLDATLGFISIQQNEIVKALTIVSVVGVPPVLVVGVYGMNFRNMPELQWAMGYPFALALMVLSTIIPVAWFKWRGWM